MEKRLFAAIFVPLSLYWCEASPAQSTELTPTQSIQLLEKIEELREKLDKSRFGIHVSSVQAYRTAAESSTAAYDFFLKCYKLVNFESRDARESEYREWKSRHVQWLRSKEHSEARRLQLEYLVLTLRAAQLSKPEEFEKLIPALIEHIDSCVERYGSLGERGRKILHEGAIGSIYGQAYDLPSTLTYLTSWGSASLDVSGIYEKAILPHYRTSERAVELASAWDKRIDQQIRLVGELGDPEQEIEFVEETLPRLRWERNMDLLKAGQHKSALTALVDVAQKNLGHDEIDGWLEKLGALLMGEQDLPTFLDDPEDSEEEAEVE